MGTGTEFDNLPDDEYADWQNAPRECAACGGEGRVVTGHAIESPDGLRRERCAACDGDGYAR